MPRLIRYLLPTRKATICATKVRNRAAVQIPNCCQRLPLFPTYRPGKVIPIIGYTSAIVESVEGTDLLAGRLKQVDNSGGKDDSGAEELGGLKDNARNKVAEPAKPFGYHRKECADQRGDENNEYRANLPISFACQWLTLRFRLSVGFTPQALSESSSSRRRSMLVRSVGLLSWPKDFGS